jgi:hypothetical protein
MVSSCCEKLWLSKCFFTPSQQDEAINAAVNGIVDEDYLQCNRGRIGYDMVEGELAVQAVAQAVAIESVQPAFQPGQGELQHQNTLQSKKSYHKLEDAHFLPQA